jgi:di/tricarboxylate transporter
METLNEHIATEKQSILSVGLHYACYAALVNALLISISHITGISDWSNIAISVIFYFLYVIVCGLGQIYAIKFYLNKHILRDFPFRKIFILCLIICFICALFSSIVNYAFVEYIDSDITSRILTTIEKTLEKQQLSPEQIDHALEIAKHNISPSAQFIFVIKNGLVWGIITGLIISLVYKIKSNSSQQQN